MRITDRFMFSTAIAVLSVVPALASSWLNDAAGYAQASRQHTALGQPLVIYFYVDWCPYCKALEREILNTTEVEGYLSGFPRVKINPEHGPAERALAKQFGVRGYPHLLIIKAPGTAPHRMSGYSKETPAQFIAGIKRVVGDPTRDQMRVPPGSTRQPSIEQTAKDSNYYRRLGESQYRAGQKTAALQSFDKWAELKPGDPVALDWVAFVCLELGKYERAIVYLNRLIEVSPTYEKGRGFYLRGRAQAELGNTAKARADAKKACDLGHPDACTVAKSL